MIFEIFILQNDLKIGFIIIIIYINVIFTKRNQNSLSKNKNSNLDFRKSFTKIEKKTEKLSSCRNDFR